jgi:C4-type Zn-finger protein
MIYKIKGMECPSCATMLELDLEEAGIKCKCSYQKEEIEIAGAHNKNKVIEIVSKSGYSISK